MDDVKQGAGFGSYTRSFPQLESQAIGTSILCTSVGSRLIHGEGLVPTAAACVVLVLVRRVVDAPNNPALDGRLRSLVNKVQRIDR